MGKSAKFFKRPTRKEKAVLSLTKGGSAETSLYDQATSSDTAGSRKNKKDILSATAKPTISKNSSSSTAGGHPPKASLAYKMQLNGGIKQAVKDLESMENDDIMSEDEDMDITGSSRQQQQNKKSKEDLDKTKPRADYVELMYGKQGGGNKRKTFMPKPALIK